MRKHGDTACGVYYDCGRCKREKHERIWRNMTPEQRAYDRMVDPLGAHTSGISATGGDDFMYSGCSCHISAPCSHCTNEAEHDD